MTRFLSILTLLLFFIAMEANAQFVGPSASPTTTPTTIDKVLALPGKDLEVTLVGNLVQSLGDEKYLFTDGTGQIQAKIKDKIFRQTQPISPEMLVEISGKVEVDEKKPPKIEVKRLTIVR